MKRVLVTGGLGYVGGQVATAIASDPDRQVVSTTRSETTLGVDWLSQAEMNSLDLMSDEDYLPVREGIDAIVHLAALNEIDSGQNLQNALLATRLGSLKLLQAAQKAEVPKFIYFSNRPCPIDRHNHRREGSTPCSSLCNHPQDCQS